MSGFIRTYPYLMASLMFLAAGVVAVAASGGARRRAVLLSGLLMMPFSFSSLVFEPSYWQPKRLVGSLVGIEDAALTFGCGALAWFVAAAAQRRSLIVALVPRQVLGRYLAGAAAGLALGPLCRLAGLGPMTTIIASFIVFGAGLLCIGGRRWPLAVAGALGFTPLYFALMKVAFVIDPEIIELWNADVLWGPKLLGVPVDEIAGAVVAELDVEALVAGAAGFGFAGPLFFGYAIGARLPVASVPPRTGGAFEAGRAPGGETSC